jgi:ribulose-5-phosphate 4-epimerase/fuculose-1-phosphate aldolase
MMGYDSEERKLREELAAIAVQVYQRGMVSAAGGNVSARIPGREEVLITATGLSLGITTPDNIVKTHLRAVQLGDSSMFRPSKETGFHCAVYRARPDVNAVVHVHPPYATAYSIRNQELPIVTVSASVGLRSVPCIDVALSGSEDLHHYVEDAFLTHSSAKAILMCAHGIIATGPDLMTAYNVADLVEATAKIAYLSAGIGVPLEDAVDQAFRPLRKTVAG